MCKLLTIIFINVLFATQLCFCADSVQASEEKVEGHLVSQQATEVSQAIPSGDVEEGQELKKKRRKRKKAAQVAKTAEPSSIDSPETMPASGIDAFQRDNSKLIKALEDIVASHAQQASIDSLLIENEELERRLDELKSQRLKEKQEFGEKLGNLKTEFDKAKRELERKCREQVAASETYIKEIDKLKLMLKDRDGVVATLKAEKEALEAGRRELLKEKQVLQSAALASSMALAAKESEIATLQAKLTQHEKLQLLVDAQALSIKELQAERDEYYQQATQAQHQIARVRGALSKLQLAGPQQVIEIPNGPFGVHYYTIEEAKDIIRRTEFKD